MINDIQIGPITLHMYGIMIAIGYISAFLISEKRAKKQGLNPDVLYGIFWCAVFGGALGSKILYYTVNIRQVIANPSIIFNFRNGWVVYGGIIGGVFASFLYCRIKKVDFVAYLDLVLPAVAFAQGCGRIGCFFAGCCYGRETESVLGITYSHSNFAPNGVKLIPTQIYSSIGDFAIAFLLMAYAKKKPAKGKVAAGYCVLYSVGRFIIEMFRNDYRGEYGPLSTSQLISVFILAIGIGMYVWAAKRQSK
ncbi:prolipoprotein diacylglyceryl transferase [Roseburia sp. 499]|uniref:prolipoprotein diacylglyceryl transferase n=1 Tax=Roseburia sp. 499 TaxID=1261634 RepID=UPI000950EF9F|nr:prolipoprotein diacylglyceryl transferase [Roseburia sp. 499]WVK70078.1 prolipoprotein diacylglyceryl transferase [Roseburia sp. 499]